MMHFMGRNVRGAIKPRQVRIYEGMLDSRIHRARKTPASLYTHKMIYEGGVFVAREPIVSTPDASTDHSE